MFRILTVCCFFGLAVLMGCSGERSPAAAVDEGGDERDYSDMLRRVREKQADTQKLDRLRTSIEAFQVDLGRPPSNIVEMVNIGYLKEVPEAPPGMVYHYDPTNGVVRTLEIQE